MAFFTAEQLAILSATTVRVATLSEFQYDPAPARFWNGSYNRVMGGVEWNGLGGMARVEGLYETRSGESQQVKFTLSGTNKELNRVLTSPASSQVNKLARVFFQLFDANWAAVGNPIPIWSGLTQPMVALRQPSEEGVGPIFSITLPCENLFYGRSRPPAGLYTDTDQQARFGGDLFFEYQSRLSEFTYQWP